MQALRRALLVGCAATAIAAWASRPHPIPTYAVIGVAARTDGRALAHSLGLRAVEWLPELGAVEVVAPPRALARVSRSGDTRIR